MDASKIAYVVEDDNDTRELIAMCMEDENYQVRQFKTVDDVLEHMGHDKDTKKVSKNLPTVVITDNDTGPLSYRGTYLAEVLQNSAVACVMHSGSPNVAEEARQYGAVCVSKGHMSHDKIPPAARQAIEALALGKINVVQNEGGRPLGL